MLFSATVVRNSNSARTEPFIISSDGVEQNFHALLHFPMASDY